MGNLLQGSAQVLAPPPPSPLAPMPRFPGFVATNTQLLNAVHRRTWSVSLRSHGGFASKKRPLGALRPEVCALTLASCE